MKDYFRWLPDYVWGCLQRLDLFVGIAAGVVFFVAGLVFGFGQSVTIYGTAGIIAVGILHAGYGVYREERASLAELERDIRVTAKLGSWAMNHPDPDPDKVSLSVHIFWEVWVTKDVSTERLGLNLIYLYDKHWWQFWKKTRFPQVGIPPKGSRLHAVPEENLCSRISAVQR